MSDSLSIRRVRAASFVTYDSLDLRFPNRGVVVLTGANGSGKSSLLRAVAGGLFGRVGRGRFGLQSGGRLSVVVRSRQSGIVTSVREAGTLSAPANPVFGSREVFLHTRVPIVSFASLGDAGRKTLLEDMLGLDTFAAAQTRARLQQGEVAEKRSKAEGALSLRREDMKRAASLHPEEGQLDVERSRRSVDIERAHLPALRSREAGLVSQRALLLPFSKTLPTVCPTCGQAWPEHPTAEHRKKAGRFHRVNEQLHETRDQLMQVEARLQRLQEDLKHASEREVAKDLIAGEALRMRKEIRLLKVNLRQLQHRERVQSEVVRVFSARGVRAVMLSGVVQTLEEFSNQELVTLGTPIRVRLGAGEDRIVMTVEGAGGGRYEECSQGERAQINVGVMLGLGQLYRDMTNGPEWRFYGFDEVLDALDNRAIESFSERIADLSRQACVIVITHRDDIVEAFPGAQHWRVSRVDGASVVEEV